MPQTFDVVIVGAGFGGTWYWNRYPGARTDSESWTYCFTFSGELLQEWNWSDRYCTQPEVLRYLQHVADEFDLRRNIRFGVRVASATYDEGWRIVSADGDLYEATYFVAATGPLSRPLTDSERVGINEILSLTQHQTSGFPIEETGVLMSEVPGRAEAAGPGGSMDAGWLPVPVPDIPRPAGQRCRQRRGHGFHPRPDKGHRQGPRNR
jgi:hypothetical protein